MNSILKPICLMAILALVLSLGVVLLPTSISAAEELLIDSNFDSDATGSDPSGWWVDDSDGDIQVVDTVYYGSSGKSVEFEKTASGQVIMAKGHGSTSGRITYEVYARSSSVTDGETLSIYGYGTGSGPWVTMAHNSGQLSYYDG